MDPSQEVLFRCILASVFLGIFLKFRGVSLGKRFFSYPKFFLLSGFILALHWVLLFWAIHIATVSLVIVAVFTFPVITTLLEPVFFKTRLLWFNLLTGVLILVGIAILVPEYSFENNATLGVLLGVLAAVAIAVRNLLCKQYISIISSSEMMFFQMAVSVILLLPTLFLVKPHLTLLNLSYLLGMGLIATALGHTLFVYSLNFFRTSTASVITSIQPLYGILLAIIFLKESPGSSIFIGGAIIVGTVILENLKAGLKPARS